MNDPRLLIIRLGMALAALLLVALLFPSVGLWVYPGFAFVPFGLFMPVIDEDECFCCNEGTQNFTAISITIASVTDGSCTDCTNLNRTWSSLWTGSSTPCTYNSTIGPVVVCAQNTSRVGASYCNGAGRFIRVSLLSRGVGTGTLYDSGNLGDPQDCSDSSGLSGLAALTAGDGFCTYTGSTATIVR